MQARVGTSVRLLLVTALLFGFVPRARAQAAVWNPATGHYYEAVQGSISWVGAKTAAEVRTFQGMSGHLATVRDDAEDNWIYYALKGSALGDYWIGLWQDPNDIGFSEPSGGWKWVTGEPLLYSHWHSGEPNDAGGTEEYAGYWSGYSWNDYSNDGAVSGYVVEYEPTLGTRYCNSEPNSTGWPALIYASGTGSIAANDLTLFAGFVPDESTALFFYGQNQAHAPFGNGWRCVGGNLYLLRPVVRAVAGWLILAVDYQNLPVGGQITAGSTWHFQAWFRDAPAGGSYFDSSDALSIAFVP